MKLTELLLAELDREVPRSRRALEEVPAGKYDWKPHEKSMIFGSLANMVATMPAWVAMGVTMNELDVAPASGSAMTREKLETSEALVKALDKSAADARTALGGTTDEFLMTPWKLLARGQVVQENAALGDDPGHDQPLGAPPRPDDRLPAVARRQGPVDLRTVRRRQAVPLISRRSRSSRARDARGPRRR
jgi:hypothetical protein